MCSCKVRHNEESSLSGTKMHIDEKVDFNAEILPVTCGEMKGMLIKRKLERGKFQDLLSPITPP